MLPKPLRRHLGETFHDDVALAARLVLSDDHDHTVLRLPVESPRGDFTMEFTDGDHDLHPLWNISSSPPAEVGRSDDPYTLIERGRVFHLVHSQASAPADVVAEADDIRQRVGGPDATFGHATTFEAWEGPPWWLTKQGWAKRAHRTFRGGSA